MLGDRLVCGIKPEDIQQRLLSKGVSLTLQRALDIAHSIKSAIDQASMMTAHSRNPGKFDESCKINASKTQSE